MITHSQYCAIPEGQKPYPDHTQVDAPRSSAPLDSRSNERHRRAIKAMFDIGAGGYDFARNTLSGAVVFSSERDLDKLTEKATEIVQWFRDRDTSCKVVISQGDYGWLRPVRVVECYPSVENVVRVADLEQDSRMGPIHLT